MNKDILLCGVGGQGTVLASKLIAAAAMAMGETVHSAETIGMAQRGGSVTSHVRIGAANAPLIPKGEAAVMLAFEPAEAVRNLSYMKEDGVVIVNQIPVKPVTDAAYSGEEMIDYLKAKCKHLIVVDAEELCKPLGNSKFFNVAILGVAVGSGSTGLDRDKVIAEIERTVPKRFWEADKQAFLTGMEFVSNLKI
ncbi:MAG: indolepyruvate oxidoreductase subunit beta [Clostridium sp.]|nr:indolepyruvate oxidoreductase subunit beta [Clostridium sp.]MCM1400278.1 indolepyruvate oxidoreductase subunit beta [Clostridium sp.]MCM1461064.1 indolepyruvate oxidoreductase subunit beta [Bacteroides sp.]